VAHVDRVRPVARYHTKNAIALERLRTEFKGKVEILQFPASVLRDLRKVAVEVVKEGSEKSPMARRVHASFTKFQAQLAGWSRISEGAYHQFGRCDGVTPLGVTHRGRPVLRQNSIRCASG
jgi:TRAP-type mannitol/chloroaromatic compound transport system substrate-binding protein